MVRCCTKQCFGDLSYLPCAGNEQGHVELRYTMMTPSKFRICQIMYNLERDIDHIAFLRKIRHRSYRKHTFPTILYSLPTQERKTFAILLYFHPNAVTRSHHKLHICFSGIKMNLIQFFVSCECVALKYFFYSIYIYDLKKSTLFVVFVYPFLTFEDSGK